MSDPSAYLLERAWVDGAVHDDVLVEISAGRFTSVTPGGLSPRLEGVPEATNRGFTRSGGGSRQLPGLTLPGLANCHSHAFHRALRGRTQRGRGTFWTWRDQMYDVAARLDPDTYLELATVTYREMVAAGITAVGEFHYLHHQPDGAPYDDPNAMGHALVEAASHAGLRMTLLDTCYLSSGFGAPPEGAQVRYDDGSATDWAARVADLSDDDHTRIGAAIHSVRAVPRDQLGTVAEAATGRPLHVHLSEQVAENDACVRAHGVTPTRLLADAGVLGPLTSAVHATHLTGDDVRLLGESATYACFCPTTERDLGDGIGPSRALHEAGSRLTLGSDSHAVIDPFEEMRAVELDERLATQQRGHWTAAELLDAAHPARLPGLGRRRRHRGRETRRPRHPRHRPRTHRRHRCGRADSGVRRRRRGRDARRGRRAGRLPGRRPRAARSRPRRRDRQTVAMTSTLLTNIGELVTNDPHADDLLGSLADAALVVDGTQVAWVGRAVDAPAADEQVDAGGRAVIPGFVDSHSHLVFAGDRSAEFAARMAGEPYAAGGIRTTVAATRAATDEQLTSQVARLVTEMRRQGTTTVEIKSGYGLSVRRRGAQPRGGPSVHRRDDVPGRPRGARRHHARGVPRPGHRPDARGVRTARALDRRVLRERGLRRRPEPGGARGGAAAGLRGRLHANQLGPGPGVRLACELGLTAVDHCTYLTDDDVAALADSGTIATLLPGVEFSTRQPYPDVRRLLDAGVRVALASDCNPGSCFTSSMPLCVALAVREMGMTPAEAVHAATAGGAAALDRDDVGALTPGKRADLVLLDAPTHVHLAYRPGVPLVAATWLGGRPV